MHDMVQQGQHVCAMYLVIISHMDLNYIEYQSIHWQYTFHLGLSFVTFYMHLYIKLTLSDSAGKSKNLMDILQGWSIIIKMFKLLQKGSFGGGCRYPDILYVYSVICPRINILSVLFIRYLTDCGGNWIRYAYRSYPP